MEQELAIRLQDDGISYQTQVEIPVTTADFYFRLESRPLLVFVDGRVHLRPTQMVKDEELRSVLRRRGYKVLELSYNSYSDTKRDQLYKQMLDNLGLSTESGNSGLASQLISMGSVCSIPCRRSPLPSRYVELDMNRIH